MLIRTYRLITLRASASLLLLSGMCIPFESAAQSIINPTSLPNVNSGRLTASEISTFMRETILLFFKFIGAACLIMIIISGYQVALAKAIGRDRSEGLTRLRVAVVGFILSVLTWYIIDFVITALTIVPPN